MKLLYLMIIIMAGCTKDPLPDPCTMPPCDSTTFKKDSLLKLIWQTPLRLDNEYTPGNQILLNSENELVAFLYDYTGNEKVLFVNKKDSGTTRFLPEEGGIMNSFYHPIAGFIIVTSKSVFTGHEAASMKKIASAPIGLQFYALYKLHSDYIYGDLGNWYDEEQIVFKLNVLTGEITTVKKVTREECIECEMIVVNSPNFQKLDNGQVIITYNTIYLENSLPGGWSRSKTEAYLLNGDKEKFLWVSEEQKGGTWFIKKNIATVITKDSIYSFDPFTSTLLWSKQITGRQWSWGTASDTIIGNKIYSLDQGHIVEINIENGDITYDSGEIFSPQSNSRMTYFEGIFYWTCVEKGYSQIFGFRASDHKLVLKMKSPNAGKPPYYNDTNFDWNGLQIDPETRLAYTADGFFGYCFRIPVKYN